jgi:hypothetical protein
MSDINATTMLNAILGSAAGFKASASATATTSPAAAQYRRTGQSAIRAKARHRRNDARSMSCKEYFENLAAKMGAGLAAGGKISCDSGCRLGRHCLRFCR